MALFAARNTTNRKNKLNRLQEEGTDGPDDGSDPRGPPPEPASAFGRLSFADAIGGASQAPAWTRRGRSSTRRWPAANESLTVNTHGQVRLLPAIADDFTEGTLHGEAARTKFQISVAAALGITPECVKITGVREESFLEAMQELARIEQERMLLEELGDQEKAEACLEKLRSQHGEDRFKKSVATGGLKETPSTELLGQVKRRKMMLEQLINTLEGRESEYAYDWRKMDFVRSRRHSLGDVTAAEGECDAAASEPPPSLANPYGE
jgi:hypothetical protein